MKVLYAILILFCTLILAIACEENTTKRKQTASANESPIPPKELTKAKKIIAAQSEDAIAAVDAAKEFKMYCAVCHGLIGNSKINGAKDLTKSAIDLEAAVAQVYYGRGLMTPFRGIMKDAEIVAVAKYIRTLRK